MSADNISGRYVLIAGSANATCDEARLRRGHDFVRALTRRLLQSGAGVVVFASDEPVHPENSRLAIVFGWTVLREASAYLGGSAAALRCIRIVTSNKAMASKMSGDQRDLIQRLVTQGAAEVAYIPDDIHTGGNIRDRQVAWSDAFVAISGGKGVTDLAAKFARRRLPVLPVDLNVGASRDDGEGAVALHRRSLTAPHEFLPYTGADLPTQAVAMSMESADCDTDRVAVIACALLAAEFAAQSKARPVDVLVLTALPVELGAVKAALGISAEAQPRSTSVGTLYWTADIDSTSCGRAVRVAAACLGGAGNPRAAAGTTELLRELRPEVAKMVGIAAGLRDKCKLGEVVFLERIVAYEPASIQGSGDGRSQSPRPDVYQLDHRLTQCVAAYTSGGTVVSRRLTARRALLVEGTGFKRSGDPVADELDVRSVTGASGEKLLRSSEAFAELRSGLHGKIEVVEMEAVGIAIACRQADCAFLVVRGISDHGDEHKSDGFHELAAMGAAVVAVDFIQHGLRLQADAAVAAT